MREAPFFSKASKRIQVLPLFACDLRHSTPVYFSHHRLSSLMLVAGWKTSCSHMCINLFAACPWRKTVGVPKRLSLEMGPYFLILSWNHSSPLFARITCRRLRLWPMMGNPMEPSGSLLEVFLVRKRKMGISRSSKLK